MKNQKCTLTIFGFEDYKSKFRIEDRKKSFYLGKVEVMNGESIFGPSEIWPAQLQDFAGLYNREG